jgi:hypothetical protein
VGCENQIRQAFLLHSFGAICNLWILLKNFNLSIDMEDAVTLNLTTNGQYSAAAAYNVQFLGVISADMNRMIWKTWIPSKIKLFA